jgi:hypothetical protein
MLSNSNHLTHGPAPLSPNTIEAPGLHLRPGSLKGIDWFHQYIFIFQAESYHSILRIYWIQLPMVQFMYHLDPLSNQA